MKIQFKNPKNDAIANLMLTGFCASLGLMAFPAFLSYVLFYAGAGLTAGATSLLVIELAKTIAGQPIDKQLEELFKAHKLVSLDEKPPVLIEKEKRDYGYRFVYNMPYGKTLKDFLKLQDSFEQILDVGVDTYINHGKLAIEVYTHQLPNKIPYNLHEEVKEKLAKMHVPIFLGKGRKGWYYLDLAKDSSPHLLISGETGWGKSSAIRTILLTLLQVSNVKIIFIDLKKKEANLFRKFSQVEVIQDERTALRELYQLQKEMKRRQDLALPVDALNLIEYNQIMKKEGKEQLPFYFVIFDEFGVKDDEGKEVTEVMRKMAMEGRSDGIHLMLCTQRPDKDIVDSNLKSNLGLRVAFHTVDDTNSQIILDCNGAELIRTKGRALVRTNGGLDEVQVVFADKNDIYTVQRTVQKCVSESTEKG